MKIQYRNFTRLGGRFPWATQVPDELIRRPKILDIWEFVQFLIALGLGFRIVTSATSWVDWLLIIIPFGYLTAAFFMALADYKYRIISTASVVASLIWLAYEYANGGELLSLVLLGIPIIFFTASMYFGIKPKNYFTWCKSNASRT